MIIRAAAMALMAVPAANASWEGEHTRRYHHADIAMAVAIDGGLITPIIWAAEQRAWRPCQWSHPIWRRGRVMVRWHQMNTPAAALPFQSWHVWRS